MGQMSAIVLQLLGLAILLAGVALAWRRWGRTPAGALRPLGRGILATVVVTLVGGLAGAPFWWMDYPASFSWDLPPLASRLLAAAGLAFGLSGILVLEWPSAARVKLYLVMLAAYLVPLVAAILVLHLDRFDWHAPITYAFFAVAGGLCGASMLHLARWPAGATAEGHTVPAPIALFLLAVAAVTGFWGLSLYVTASGPVALLWIWPADPLTSRLIGTMLLTLGLMSLMSRKDAGRASLSLTVLTIYGASVVAAGLMNIPAGKPLPAGYMVVLGGIGALAVALRLRYNQPLARSLHS